MRVWLCRVMTVSFHKFGDYFFPGTGDVKVRSPALLLKLSSTYILITGFGLLLKMDGSIVTLLFI